MNKNLDESIRDFADNGEGSMNKVYQTAMHKAKSPRRARLHIPRYIAAAVSVCMVILICSNFTTIANAVNYLLDMIRIEDTIAMVQVSSNRLEKLIDQQISLRTVNHDTIHDKQTVFYEDEDFKAHLLETDPIAYQIIYEEVETPCYIYIYSYHGYKKAIVMDKDTKNIKEIDEWLQTNAGIVSKITDNVRDAKKLLNEIEYRKIEYSQIHEVLDGEYRLPNYFPQQVNGKYRDTIQGDAKLRGIIISYTCEGEVKFYPSLPEYTAPNYITLSIEKIDTQFNIMSNTSIAIENEVSIHSINEIDIYIADNYYVWKNGEFLYVLYTTSVEQSEMLKMIESMT